MKTFLGGHIQNTAPSYVARNQDKLPSPPEGLALEAPSTNATVGDFESEQSDLAGLFQEEEADIVGDSKIWFMQFQKAIEQKEMTMSGTMEEDNHIMRCEKVNMHKDPSQVEMNAFMLQGHELGRILHKRPTPKLDEDLFMSTIEEFCKSC